MDPVFYRALSIAQRIGLSQSDLAAKLGISPQNITNWKVRRVPADQYLPIADALDCSLDELLQRERFIPAEPFIPWPFEMINEKKLRSLPSEHAQKLGGAILGAATALGIDLSHTEDDPANGVVNG